MRFSLATKRAGFAILMSFALANFLFLFFIQALSADQMRSVLPPDLTGSQKTVDQPEAHPEEAVQYTIVISNSGDSVALASLQDVLPWSLVYETGSLTATQAAEMGVTNQTITWTGTVSPGQYITISFQAALSSSLAIGDRVTNTVVITGAGMAFSRTATTTIIGYEVFLPFVTRGILPPTLHPVSQVCGTNEWTVSWNTPDTGVTFELQEAQTADFEMPATYETADTSFPFNHPASIDNLYYYRVRGVSKGVMSVWSNMVMVRGNFLDDFSDVLSGWAVGETTAGRFNYVNNEYAIASKDTGISNVAFLLSSLSPDVSRDGYIVEADVHWQPGSPTNGLYGLVFGADETAARYYFVALLPAVPDYRLFFFNSELPPGENLRLIARESSSVINPGTAVNHIKVSRVGATIQLEINGVNMGTWTDSEQMGSTRAGVIMSANPVSPVAEARFDNFGLGFCDAVIQQRALSPDWKPVPLVPQDVAPVDLGW